MHHRSSVALAALLTMPMLHGCATVAERPAVSAQANAVVPFQAAKAGRVGESADVVISWSAPGATSVTIFAGTDPDSIERVSPVARGGSDGSATVTGLAPGKRWFFALVPDRGAPLVIADRALHLATMPNLRDIGGYRTSDGRWVRMGMLYRSDQLDRLSDADFATFSNLGVGLIADLRTATERTREPDRVPAGTEHLVLDVAAGSKGGLGGDMRQAMQMIATGKGAEMLTEANREFVSLDSARSAYATLLDRIAAPSAPPTLYHCTAGKDRTGWATAVILTMLGVPRETVIADYLASNIYLHRKNEAALVAIAKSPTPISRENLEPVMTVRAAYIEAAFAEVERRYGSFDRYVSEGLGIDPATVERLRHRYLTGQSD
ncbi:tyrosine-protein phosphatase [Sphingomonas cavernae]|nr:tyrosine-protein phosphatase [Sphingomonas cavernae]